MAAKIDVVLLAAVKGIGNKNDVVSVSIAYAKNVLFAQKLAKPADANVKNALAQKKVADQKQHAHIGELWDKLVLYIQAQEPLTIKRKVTPSGGLYEKVHENHVREALSQWTVQLPPDIVIAKGTRDTVGSFQAVATWEKKTAKITFTIVESLY